MSRNIMVKIAHPTSIITGLKANKFILSSCLVKNRILRQGNLYLKIIEIFME